MLKTKSSAVTAGWSEVSTEIGRRAIHMDIYGETGTGRTSLALTAPGPIALAHTAEKIDGLVNRARKDKVIRTVNFGGVFNGTAKDIAEQAAPVWDNMAQLWRTAMSEWARTIIMDTASEGWEMLRVSRFGTVTPQGRVENLYGPVNAEWRSLFKRARNPDNNCHVITIHQVKDEYVDKPKPGGGMSSHRTGKLVRACMKEMPYMPDVAIETSRTSDGGFRAIIRKGWYNVDTEGMEFLNEDITFSNIMTIITGIEGWE